MKNYAPRHAAHAKADRFQYSSSATRAGLTFNFIDRPAILPSAYTETYDGGNDVSIMLRQWPVIGISGSVSV
jgi:hypothetical protein